MLKHSLTASILDKGMTDTGAAPKVNCSTVRSVCTSDVNFQRSSCIQVIDRWNQSIMNIHCIVDNNLHN